MPTYNSPLSIVPTEYVPIDYRHDAMFEMAEAQQTASNIAMVKSRYEDLLGMDLSTDKAKTTLSSYMKNAETELQKISGASMLIYDNAKKATDIFKPLTDTNGQYSFIAGDHAYTSLYKKEKDQIETSKTADKGANYNPALEKILDAKYNLFQKTNKPEDWKYFYSNTQDYVPGYNYQEEKAKLDDRFLKMIDDGIETSVPKGNGYMETLKDKSIYADKYREFLDANLSPQAKQQMKFEKQAEYWENLSAYALAKDPVKQAEIKNALTQQYIDTYQEDIKIRLDNAKEIKNKLEIYEKMSDPNDQSFMKSVGEELKLVNSRIEQLQNKKITSKEVEPMLDVNNWASGEESYANYFVDKEITKMANAQAMTRGVHKYETDQTYLNLKNLDLGWAKLTEEQRWHNISHMDKLAELAILQTPVGTTVYDPVTGGQVKSLADAGKQKLEKDVSEITNNKDTFGALEAMTGSSFSYTPEELTQLSNMTYEEAINKKLIVGDNEVLTKLIQSANIPNHGKINPKTDNATQVLTWLKTMSYDDRYIDFLTKSFSNDPQKAKDFNKVKVQLAFNNSKAEALNTAFKKSVVEAFKDVATKGGLKFLSVYPNISTPEELQKAVEDFSNASLSYSVDELNNKFYESYNNNSSSLSSSKGFELVYSKPTDAKATKVFENRVFSLSQGASASLLNNFIKDFSTAVVDYKERPEGYKVRFTSNMTDAESKRFVTAYNTMASANGEDAFEVVTTLPEALSKIDTYFEKNANAIPTSAIDPNKVSVDKNSEFLQKHNTITVVNLDRTKLKSLYGIEGSPIRISLSNNTRGSSTAIDIKIDGNAPYPKLADDNTTILRDANGNVQLEYISSHDALIKTAITKYQAQGYSLSDAKMLVNQNLAKDITKNSEVLGTSVLNNLELIKYLNTKGKSVTKLTKSLMNQYL